MSQRAGASAIELAEQLKAQFKRAIPPNDAIVKRGLDEVLGAFGGDLQRTKVNVSKILTDAEERAYGIYKNAERLAIAHAIRTVFGSQLSGSASPEDALELVARNAEALDRFFLSVSQGRRARAGSAVETFFETLFRKLGYVFEREHVINGTPDFIFPSVARFRQLPMDCVIFTCKRTLRERWRQITSEGSRGFILFLGTYDPSVLPADLAEMMGQKVMLVVPEHIRAASYANQENVLSVETFLLDHLDPAMERWRRNRVIP